MDKRQTISLFFRCIFFFREPIFFSKNPAKDDLIARSPSYQSFRLFSVVSKWRSLWTVYG